MTLRQRHATTWVTSAGPASARRPTGAYAALIEEKGVPTRHPRRHDGGRRHLPRRVDHPPAGRNRSDHLRTVMTVIYYADGARVLPEVTAAQEVDRRAWLGDRPLGALADHELNPVL